MSVLYVMSKRSIDTQDVKGMNMSLLFLTVA